MKLTFYKSESTIYPELIDSSSSKKVTYIRQNVVENQGANESGNSYTYYTYDECKLTKEEYKQYLQELSIIDIRQQRADIDYLALMMGIDLEV